MPTNIPLVAIQAVSLSETPKIVFIAPSNRILRQMKTKLNSHLGLTLKSKGLLADAIEWFEQSGFVLIGPSIGGASIAVSLVPFLKAGATKVVFIGLAGALNQGLQIADYLLPISASSGQPDSATLKIQTDESLRINLLPTASSAHLSQVVSVENPYATNIKDIDIWKNRGCSAVEMELYMLASLQKDYSFNLFTALVVSDVIQQSGKHLKQFNSKAVKNSSQRLVDSFVEKLC